MLLIQCLHVALATQNSPMFSSSPCTTGGSARRAAQCGLRNISGTLYAVLTHSQEQRVCLPRIYSKLRRGSLAKNTKFFDEQLDQSDAKARVIQKYFFAWANVITPTAKAMSNKIGYFDLYAGPGRYRDGAKSTPLLILEKAIANPTMASMLVTMFNDANEDHSS